MRKILLFLAVSMLGLGPQASNAAGCSNSVGAPNDPTGQFSVCYAINQTGTAMFAPQAWVQHCYGRNHCDVVLSGYLPQSGVTINTFPTITLGSKSIPIPNTCLNERTCTPNQLPYPGVGIDTNNLMSVDVMAIPVDVGGFVGVCLSSMGSCTGSGTGIGNVFKVNPK